MIIEKVEMKNGFIMCIDWVEHGRFFHLEVTPKDVIDNYKAAQQLLAQPTRLSGSPADENHDESAVG